MTVYFMTLTVVTVFHIVILLPMLWLFCFYDAVHKEQQFEAEDELESDKNDEEVEDSEDDNDDDDDDSNDDDDDDNESVLHRTCSEETITYDFDDSWLLENDNDTRDTITALTDTYNSDDSDDSMFNL